MTRFRLFLLLERLLMTLPRSWRKAFFLFLAWLAHRLAPSRNRVIAQNLAFAFGGTLPEAETERIERYCYRNLLLNFLQVMENRRNRIEDFHKAVCFENREAVDALLAQGRPIVFISAHFGNWELGATALSKLIVPTTSIYKSFDRPEFNPYLLEARTRHGMEMIEKKGPSNTSRERSKTAVRIADDRSGQQRAPRRRRRFFGHATYHSSTPASLSSKYKAPIVPLYILTEDDEHYTIRFEDPIEVAGDDPETIVRATQMLVTTLERIIRAHPKFWFWCHKRWKGEFPEIYRK